MKRDRLITPDKSVISNESNVYPRNVCSHYLHGLTHQWTVTLFKLNL